MHTGLGTPDLERVQESPWRMLNPEGHLLDNSGLPSVPILKESMRWMVLSRRFDQRGISLQRQGRLGTFSPVMGQEASVVGSAMATDPARDWIVPQYRELPAMVRHGFPLEQFLLYFRGHPAGAGVPPGVNLLPIQIALAAQLPHAVGLAWGLQLQQKDGIVLVYFGDGASSEGDFHEACNLAGLVKAPVVFLLQNNGWAISTPRASQSAAEYLADRALGYGFPGVVVDGNDLLAVYGATNQAIDRARAGGGPTLIETQTYRMGPHNTADDPSLYVQGAEKEGWAALDPLDRVEAYLRANTDWPEDERSRLEQQADHEIDEALAAADATVPPTAESLFNHVFLELSPRLGRQLRRMERS